MDGMFLQEHLDKKLEQQKQLVCASAAAGNTECLQLLVEQGYPRDSSACAAAAEHGQLAALEREPAERRGGAHLQS